AGLRLQFEREDIWLFLEPDRFQHRSFCASEMSTDLTRHFDHATIFLRLIQSHPEPRLGAIVWPAPGAFQCAAAVRRLLKEDSKILPGSLFHFPAKICGSGVAIPVLPVVGPDAVPEIFGSYIATQHMQYPAAFLVGM